MRLLYSVIFYLLLPFIFVRLYWRGFKAPSYRQRWQERVGFYRQPSLKNAIWIHAVSVGEAEAMFPLVKQLQNDHPTTPFLVTTTTPTGSARVQSILGGSVTHVYLPHDILGAVRRFFTQFQPQIAIIMETEIWPNLFAECGQRQTPLFIINARLSEKSARGYLKISPLVHPTLANVTHILTQTDTDARRFLSIGASTEQVKVCGNIKFDTPAVDTTITQGQTIREQFFPGRFVWIIASTHQDEELPFLKLYKQLKEISPTLLLLIVPRHPERFNEVKNLCLAQSLKVVMRTETRTPFNNATDVYIADTLGELKMLYAAADIAFVGGSLVPVGGHNVLEAAAVNVPVLFGPYMNNFTQIAEGLINANAAVQCADITAILTAFQRLYHDSDYRYTLTANAHNFIIQNQGATKNILHLLNKTILTNNN